jgi:hypothetical protein
MLGTRNISVFRLFGFWNIYIHIQNILGMGFKSKNEHLCTLHNSLKVILYDILSNFSSRRATWCGNFYLWHHDNTQNVLGFGAYLGQVVSLQDVNFRPSATRHDGDFFLDEVPPAL